MLMLGAGLWRVPMVSLGPRHPRALQQQVAAAVWT